MRSRRGRIIAPVIRRAFKLFKFPGIMFPDRLQVTGLIVNNSVLSYASAPNTYLYNIISDPVTGCGGNMSGLYWLLSGVQSNGTSYAPYNTGIVLSVKMEVYAKTVASSIGNTGGQVVLFPLAPGATTTSLTPFNASEAYKASRLVCTPDSPNTTNTDRPSIVKNYDMAELFGVTKEVYMSSPQLYGFYVGGHIADFIAVALATGMESGATDSSYTMRVTIKMTFTVILNGRNSLNTSAPHS